MKKLTFLMMLLGVIFIAAGNIVTVKGQTYPVELFKDINFGGGIPNQYGGEFSRDIMDDGWNDNVESIKVAQGYKITLYEDKLHRGSSIVLYPGEYPDLSMQSELRFWNDRASSLKIEKLSDPNLPLIKLIYGDNGNLTQMIGLDGIDEYKKVNSLLLNDRVTSAEIPEEYKVTFYDRKEFDGDANTVPVSGRIVNMSEFELQSKVSSIKIEWNKYKLAKVDMKELSRTDLNPVEAPIKNGSGTIDNPSAATSSITESRETTYTSSATTSWENTTSVGFTYSQTVKAEAAVPGLGSAGVETSFAASIANEFAFGKQETKTQEEKIIRNITVSAPPYSSVSLYFQIIPAEVEYDLTYTYVSVDDKGEPDKKGKDKVIKGKMKVKMPGSVDLRVRDKNAPTDPKAAAADKDFLSKAIDYVMSTPQRIMDYARYLAGYPASNSDNPSTTNSNTNVNPPVKPSDSSTSPTNQETVPVRTRTDQATTNVALNKKATQSTNFSEGDYLATKAVDGVKNDKWNFSGTKGQAGDWWEVDLGQVYEINKIVVSNRADENYWMRLQNFYVMVSETPIQSNSTDATTLFSGPNSFTKSTDPLMNIEGNKKGRYVRIFFGQGNNELSLAEVEVFGR